MINNVTLMGRLTKDIELKTTQNGKEVCTFTIAVDKAYGKETDFLDIVAWNKQATFVSQYFHKGDLIALTGSIQTREYEDKNGNKVKKYEILANQFSFCGGKTEKTETKSNPINIEYEDEDALPF